MIIGLSVSSDGPRVRESRLLMLDMSTRICAVILIAGGLAACAPRALRAAAAAPEVPITDARCTEGLFFEGRGCLAATKAAPPPGRLEQDDARFAMAIAALSLEPRCPAETVDDLLGVPPERKGRWQELAGAANAIAEGLEAFEKSDETHRWSAIASARSGILFARLATSLRACTLTGPSPIALFGVNDQMRIETMRAAGEHFRRPELIEKASELENAKLAFWTKRKASELEATEKVAIAKLGRGVALANAYGVAHDIFDRARAELSTLRAAIGAERMIDELASWLDPTDPSRRRRLDAVRGSL